MIKKLLISLLLVFVFIVNTNAAVVLFPYVNCTSVAAINQTASTTVITGISNNRIYICAILLVSATAQNVSLVEGTGTVCATGPTALIGGTTASVALAANGGFATISSTPFMTTQVNSDNVCILQSAAGNVSGIISYSQQ